MRGTRVLLRGRHRLLRAGEVGGQARRAAKFWDWFYGSRLQKPEGSQVERPEAAGTEWISQPGALLPKLLEAFHPRCPGTILEIGCGNSSLAQQLHEKLGGAMLAVDISEAALRRAAERAAGRSGLRFAVADATDLGHLFKDGDVGAVVDKGLADTLQFRARTRESRALRRALFAEVSRILAPGGVYAMVTPKVRPQYLHTVDWEGVETREVEEPKGLLFDLASRGDPGATAPCARAYLHLCRKPGAPEFWSCDAKCQRAYDKYTMAREEADRVQQKVDRIMKDARREVGIWSVFGVQEVRDRFWAAWQSGKDLAMRYTMFDAIFMAFGGKEETLVSILLKLAFQYAANLTLGLISAFFLFMYHVYQLLVNYGEDAVSGLAFFLLVLVSAASLIGTYLLTVYGVVVGGGLFVLKHAERQAIHGQGTQRPRQVQYGGGRVGGYRPHHD